MKFTYQLPDAPPPPKSPPPPEYEPDELLPEEDDDELLLDEPLEYELPELSEPPPRMKEYSQPIIIPAMKHVAIKMSEKPGKPIKDAMIPPETG